MVSARSCAAYQSAPKPYQLMPAALGIAAFFGGGPPNPYRSTMVHVESSFEQPLHAADFAGVVWGPPFATKGRDVALHMVALRYEFHIGDHSGQVCF